ncbi:DUF748 domain-containing protein [Oleiharenicola lentus]|uniref:DUF748 domain-containing protein n=1 Tax=Oleiharenicola lentus TaxID=2508720 RepID=UPI003F66BE2A
MPANFDNPDPATKRPRQHHRFRTAFIILGVIVVLLIVVRLVLPGFIKSSINKRLNEIPDYSGQVADVDLSLYRGAYSLHGVEIVKRNGQVREPFFKAEAIDFSLAWRELFRGKVVSDIYLEKPELNFVQGASDASSQVATDKRWQDVINDIFPIDITFLQIRDGLLRYVNNSTTPRVDVYVANMQATATGLRNRTDEENKVEFPARINLHGETIGGGRLNVTTELEPLATQPHFLLKVELENVSMPSLNEFLRAYANVDVSAGTFKGYVEVLARDGGFNGYFKPFFENMDFKALPGEDPSLGKQIWEGVVRFVAFVFKNHEKDQLATRVPFSGEFGDAKVGVWQTIMNTLRHAFVRPWPEKLESRQGGRVSGDPEPAKKEAAAPPTSATKPPSK